MHQSGCIELNKSDPNGGGQLNKIHSKRKQISINIVDIILGSLSILSRVKQAYNKYPKWADCRRSCDALLPALLTSIAAASQFISIDKINPIAATVQLSHECNAQKRHVTPLGHAIGARTHISLALVFQNHCLTLCGGHYWPLLNNYRELDLPPSATTLPVPNAIIRGTADVIAASTSINFAPPSPTRLEMNISDSFTFVNQHLSDIPSTTTPQHPTACNIIGEGVAPVLVDW
eukprot:scaffold12282_cov75-Cyclotella_meneghiniana.AAC.2